MFQVRNDALCQIKGYNGLGRLGGRLKRRRRQEKGAKRRREEKWGGGGQGFGRVRLVLSFCMAMI